MEFRTVIFVFGFVLIASSSVNAGDGIEGGTMDYTLYLGKNPQCTSDQECIAVCQNQAKDASKVVGAKCVKFSGNYYEYCCCYGATTNACCQYANSGLDCHISGPAVTA